MTCKRCKELEGQLARAVELLNEAAPALLEGAQIIRHISMAAGGEPHWMTKDFNVLYRVALAFFDASEAAAHTAPSSRARQALGAQLERLKPAFTDTEQVRQVARERKR